jgi:hypothetical protein
MASIAIRLIGRMTDSRIGQIHRTLPPDVNAPPLVDAAFAHFNSDSWRGAGCREAGNLPEFQNVPVFGMLRSEDIQQASSGRHPLSRPLFYAVGQNQQHVKTDHWWRAGAFRGGAAMCRRRRLFVFRRHQWWLGASILFSIELE